MRTRFPRRQLLLSLTGRVSAMRFLCALIYRIPFLYFPFNLASRLPNASLHCAVKLKKRLHSGVSTTLLLHSLIARESQSEGSRRSRLESPRDFLLGRVLSMQL